MALFFISCRMHLIFEVTLFVVQTIKKVSLEQNSTRNRTKCFVNLPRMTDKMFLLCLEGQSNTSSQFTLYLCLFRSLAACQQQLGTVSKHNHDISQILIYVSLPLPFLLVYSLSFLQTHIHTHFSSFCSAPLHMHPSFPLPTFPIFCSQLQQTLHLHIDFAVLVNVNMLSLQ